MFLRQLLRYASTVAVLAVCCLFLLWQSYQASRGDVIESVQADARAGLAFLSSQSERARIIAGNLLQNEHFLKAILVRGTPRPDEMIALKRVQELIKQYVLANQLDEDAFLLFPNNRSLLTVNLCSDQLEPSYPALFRVGDLTADGFHALAFSPDRPAVIGTSVVSSHAAGRQYDALIAYADIRVAGAARPLSVLGLITRQQAVAAAFLPQELRDSASLSLTDASGTLLTWRGDAVGLANVYIVRTDAHGIKAEITIPRAYVFDKIWPATLGTLLIVLIGILAAVVGALLHSLRAARALRPAWSAVQQQVGAQPRHQSEYAYLSGAVQQMGNTNRQQASHILSLRQSAVHLAMVYLFINGIRTRREEIDLKSLVAHDFDAFRVLSVRWGGEGLPTGQSPLAEAILRAVQSWLDRMWPNTPALCIHMGTQEIAVILFKPPEDIKQSLTAMTCAVQASLPGNPPVHVGASRPASGLRQVRLSYLEASQALFAGRSHAESGAFVYDGSPRDEQTFDLPVLLQLSDLILSGDVSAVDAIIRQHIMPQQHMVLSPQGGAQRFYLLRQVLQNIAGTLPDDTLPEPLPPFIQTEEYSTQIEALALFARQVAGHIASRRDAGNQQLKARLIQHIRENARNPALNAASIAGNLGISEKYVYALIREQTGKPLGHYLNDIRVDIALGMLGTSDAPITDIWQAAGFGSENTFYRAFQKQTGQSPGKWRANAQPES